MNWLLVIANAIFWIGLWQLDHMVAPQIWDKRDMQIEIICLPWIGPIHMRYGAFYCTLFFVLVIAYFLTMVAVLG